MFKRSFCLVLCLSMLIVFPANAFSQSNLADSILYITDVGEHCSIPLGTAEYIAFSDGVLIPVSDIPTFSSYEEAAPYIESFLEEIGDATHCNPAINLNSRSTHGDVEVASDDLGYGTLHLRVTYTTSGNSNTGTITECDAYTQLSGFTLGYRWEEDYCDAYVTDTGKNIYAYANGTITLYLIISGVVDIYDIPYSIDGYAYVLR